ncbi:unnamed protein product [Peniophora sp. CBMAI 1063]|nr:unnamed protein product [Peniophora sp. CBMAI 1063]
MSTTLSATLRDPDYGMLFNQDQLLLVSGTQSKPLDGEDLHLTSISDAELLKYTRKSDPDTYRVRLETTMGDGFDVIVKVAQDLQSFDRLVKLGKLYAGLLFDREQPYVPLCYGAFKVSESAIHTRLDTKGVGCLVLEDCGKPLTMFNIKGRRALTERFRIRLFNAVLKVHMAGICYQFDEDEKHVFDVDGPPRLVGFTNAKMSDEPCLEPGNTHKIPIFRAPSLDPDEFPRCDALFLLGEFLELWTPNLFSCSGFDGQTFPYEMLNKPFRVADMRPSFLSKREGLKAAMEGICQYLEKYYPEAGRDYRVMIKINMHRLSAVYEARGTEPNLLRFFDGDLQCSWQRPTTERRV